ILLENSDLDEYQYPLYGIQPNNGMASTAIQWSKIQDKDSNLPWINNLSIAINAVTTSTNETRNSSILELGNMIDTIPSPSVITSQELRDWSPSEPAEWLQRIDNNSNISAEIVSLNIEIETMISSLGSDSGLVAIHAGQISAMLGVLQGMQYIDYKELMISNLPAEDNENPWQSDGPILTSFVVITDPEIHEKDVIGDVQEEISLWASDLLEQARQETGDEDVSVFSFSQLATGQNANLGKELGILNSVCLLLLGFILWTKFRSLRDTASVLTLTVFAIIATYGSAGLLTLLGLKMPFNAAMNSIPILLLAIGVDYGLHVVSRIREELLDEEKNNPQNRETLKDFSIDARREAIRKGTLLTSAALMVAIFTDIVGFLSFRFSTQAFLVSFGTVIAIGLFYIYILSITVLPALMMIIPPKKLKLEKSGKIEIGPVSKWIGSLTKTPVKVVAVTIIISIPMFIGFQQLEVGFDTRDNFDDSVPVVQDFLVIADEFQSSPAPLYVVINGDVISSEGRALYNEVIVQLDGTDGINGVPVGIWSVLEESRISYPVLDSLLTEIESDESAYSSLKDWLMSADGRNISSGNLNSDASQTVISFQAATLDWQDAVDFEVALSEKLTDVAEASQGNFEAKLSGRSLILAQVTADVADSAVISTATVAGVI
ncbi:MAG: MMPL family transporter, partial [Euryarchaeota archaeon]